MILRKISTDHLKLGRSRCSNIELFLAKPLLNGCGLQHGVARGLAESRAAGGARDGAPRPDLNRKARSSYLERKRNHPVGQMRATDRFLRA
jgi:hypothetical protein